MITMTPRHWLFFVCLIASAVLVYFALRVLVLDEERREFATFILTLSGSGAAWGTWAHLRTHARLDQLQQLLAEQSAAQREAFVLRTASRSKGNLSSVD